MCMSEVASPQTEPLAVLTQDSSLELSLDSFGLPHFRRKTATSVQNGKTFTNLQSITQTVSSLNNDHFITDFFYYLESRTAEHKC